MKIITSNKRVLLTGGTGFIGSNLSQYLVANNWDVRLVVREHSDLKTICSGINSESVYIYDGSYNSMIAIMRKTSPDVVIHLASCFLTQHLSCDIPLLVQSNITFGTQLLEAMTETGVRHFVNTGTSWQHYQNQPYLPVNLYAATKQAFYDVLAYYVDAHGINAISLELFDTYGPNDTRKKIIPLLLHAWRSGVTLDMSPGEQELVLVHVMDVCSAYVIALNRLTTGQTTGHEIYSVRDDPPIQLKLLVGLIGELTGRPIPVNFGKRAYRVREVMRVWSGETLPDWLPQTKISAELIQIFS